MKTRADLPGVCIWRGPADWQIIQRRLDGKAAIALAGTWRSLDQRPVRVEVRLVRESDNLPPCRSLDWAYAETLPDGQWRMTLKDVPAGGLYRIETRLQPAEDEWRLTGDRIHHIGVGDLWAVAGQSNAVGYGHGGVDDPPELGVHVFRLCEEWALADHPLHDPTRTRHEANFDTGWNDHSPWLAFGRILRRSLVIPIGLVPTALGGSPLSAWDPTSACHPLYDNLMDMIRAACAWRDYSRRDERDGGPLLIPSEEQRPGRIAGIVWYQGCSDTGDETTARSYGERFSRFVAAVRGALDAPSLPFVTVQISRCHYSQFPLGWALVREEQRRAASAGRFIAVVPTLDIESCRLADCIHLGPAANLIIGQRCAAAALGMVYGNDLLWQAPAPVEAFYEGGDRRRVLLRFGNVAGELRLSRPRLEQFTVADEEGDLPLTEASLVKPDKVRLILSRTAKGRLLVHNCASHDPDVCLLDREGRPILGFYGWEVR